MNLWELIASYNKKICTLKSQQREYSTAWRSLTIFSAKENVSDILCALKNVKDTMVSFSRLKFGTEGYRTKTLLKTFSIVNSHFKVFKVFH